MCFFIGLTTTASHYCWRVRESCLFVSCSKQEPSCSLPKWGHGPQRQHMKMRPAMLARLLVQASQGCPLGKPGFRNLWPPMTQDSVWQSKKSDFRVWISYSILSLARRRTKAQCRSSQASLCLNASPHVHVAAACCATQFGRKNGQCQHA